jgi:hypothetical protein
MNPIEFHSHEQQDEYVYNVFNGKKNGFFLDISCGNPIIGSNSYTLEKFCNWDGIGFDIYDVEKDLRWSQYRKSKFVQMDVTSEQMTEWLKSNIPSDLVVDYISVDVDAWGTNLALQTLHRILDSGIKFKAMTFEHEYHGHGPEIRDEQRRLLKAQGMEMLFEDVRLWSRGPSNYNNTEIFEDWWIHPDYFDSNLLEAKRAGIYTFECIKTLRQLLNNTDYQASHVCNRSFPDEYTLFWDENERNEWVYNLYPMIKTLFDQYYQQK